MTKPYLVRVVGFDRASGQKKDFTVPSDISLKGLEDIRREVDVRAMYWPNGTRCELNSVTELIVLEPSGSRISPNFRQGPMQGYASRWNSEEPLHEMPHSTPRSRAHHEVERDAMILELIMVLSQACDFPFPAQYEQTEPRQHGSPFTAQDEPVAHEPSRFKAFAAKKWSRFKNAVRTHPETDAYVGAVIASVPISFIPHAPKTTPFASLLAGMAILGVVTRENILKKSYTKAERIVSSVIAGAGYAASAALVFADHHILGTVLTFSSLAASILYKPVKEFIVNAEATLWQKIQLLVNGATIVGGLTMMIYGALMTTFDLFKGSHLTGSNVLDMVIAISGMLVSQSAAERSVSISENIKSERPRREPETA